MPHLVLVTNSVLRKQKWKTKQSTRIDDHVLENTLGIEP